MRKCALLLLMVLSISTTAWATCTVDVSVNPSSPTPSQPVGVNIGITVPSNYLASPAVDVTPMWNVYYVDVVYKGCGCGCGCRTDTLQPIDLGNLCGGMYFVVVRVWVNSQICCIPVKMFCGMGSTWFTVKFPCRCP